MHKHIPTLSAEDYARQVLDRAAARRALVVSATAQPVTREGSVTGRRQVPNDLYTQRAA
jgi:hypothetical protein